MRKHLLQFVLIFIVAQVVEVATATAQAVVTGRNVTGVRVPTGQLTMSGPRRWVEKGDDGKTFNFAEARRDDWSVYLFDASRGVNLQLDLKKKQVFYSDTRSARRRLYAIVGATAAAQARPATPKVPAPPATQSDQAFINEILTAHNQLRGRHGSQPLRWSANLARTASAWALSMKSRGCSGGHSGQAGVGENISWAGSSGGQAPTGAGRNAVAQWYWCEVGKYDPRNAAFSGQTGHYTQVVWASTTQVGCALVSCGPNEQKMWPGQQFSVQVVVCQYSPAGNVSGQFPQNVKHSSQGPRPAGVSCN